MRHVFESVASAETSGLVDFEKLMELSPVEVENLSGQLENLGEQLKQGTTEIVESKNKGSVTDFEGKLHDIDKALSVDYTYPNLNLSELESAKVDSGNLLASKTHVPFDNLE